MLVKDQEANGIEINLKHIKSPNDIIILAYINSSDDKIIFCGINNDLNEQEETLSFPVLSLYEIVQE